MTGNDWTNLVTALGPVGAIIVAVTYVFIRSGFLAREDPSRSDIIDRIDRLDGKMDQKMSNLDDKIGALRDRQTNIEASMREISRRMDRIDR